MRIAVSILILFLIQSIEAAEYVMPSKKGVCYASVIQQSLKNIEKRIDLSSPHLAPNPTPLNCMPHKNIKNSPNLMALQNADIHLDNTVIQILAIPGVEISFLPIDISIISHVHRDTNGNGTIIAAEVDALIPTPEISLQNTVAANVNLTSEEMNISVANHTKSEVENNKEMKNIQIEAIVNKDQIKLDNSTQIQEETSAGEMNISSHAEENSSNTKKEDELSHPQNTTQWYMNVYTLKKFKALFTANLDMDLYKDVNNKLLENQMQSELFIHSAFMSSPLLLDEREDSSHSKNRTLESTVSKSKKEITINAKTAKALNPSKNETMIIEPNLKISIVPSETKVNVTAVPNSSAKSIETQAGITTSTPAVIKVNTTPSAVGVTVNAGIQSGASISNQGATVNVGGNQVGIGHR
jgi:hypothetical protein